MVYSHPGSKSAFKKKKKEWERKTFWFSRENKILVHLSVAGFKTINVNFVWMALSLYRYTRIYYHVRILLHNSLCVAIHSYFFFFLSF